MAYPGYEGYASADPYAGYGYVQPAPAYPAYGGVEEVRTVFITGFPPDVKERELNNLLRFLPGYEASQMNWKNGQASTHAMHALRCLSLRLIMECAQAQGFALFTHGAAARQACESIAHLWCATFHIRTLCTHSDCSAGFCLTALKTHPLLPAALMTTSFCALR
jgi:hypothetical protein